MTLYAAILAGGVGTRLWPRSRQGHPKQFSDITGSGRTMIQATVDRLCGTVDDDNIYVLTGAEYADLVAEQLPQVGRTNVIAEPSGRNTAPAIGLACVHLLRRDADAVVAFLHADHIMLNEPVFRLALERAATAAEVGHLVTLGVEPTSPHTGYGYIRRGEILAEGGHDDIPVYAVHGFLEKPDLATAEAFLSAGEYYWNAGIFVCRADQMLAEMERQLPEVYACLREIDVGHGTEAEAETLASVWQRMPNVSIDHGVMEDAQNVAVVPLRAGWKDVGSWDALDGILMPDDHGNLTAKTDVVVVDSFNNIVYCEDKMVAMVGVDDLVVVDTGDALLVGHRNQMQKVKDVVETLRAQNRSNLL